jgi:hypothetical protein
MCPARVILRAPHNLLNEADPTTAGAKRRMLEMAAHNLWQYARNKKWAWGIMPNPGNKMRMENDLVDYLEIPLPDGRRAVPLGGNRVATDTTIFEGWGLLAGYTTWDNCAGFNSSLIFLARHVFGFAGVVQAAISGDYLTTRVPRGTFDACFEPTVRTFGRGYSQVGLYFFTGHQFVEYDNHYFDATSDTVFDQAQTYVLRGQQSDGKYCDLDKVTDPLVKAQFQNQELYRLSNENNLINAEIGMPNVTQKYLVRVIDNKYNHWSGYLLTAQNGLSANTLARFRQNYTVAERLQDSKMAEREPGASFPRGKMEHHSYWWGRKVVDV